MKRLSIVLMFMLAFVLVACGGNGDEITPVINDLPNDVVADEITVDEVVEDDVTVQDYIQIVESPYSDYLRNIIDILEARNFHLNYITASVVMSGIPAPVTSEVDVHVFPDNSQYIHQWGTSPFSDGIYDHFINVITPTRTYSLRMSDEIYSINELDSPIVPGVGQWYQTMFTMPVRWQGYAPSPIGGHEVYAISFGDDSSFATLYLDSSDFTSNYGLAVLEWQFAGTKTTAEVRTFNTNPDRTLLTVEIPEYFERSN